MFKPELLYEDEAVKYHARCIRNYCKDHRCATCTFYVDGKCNFLKTSPDQWKGIEEVKK